MRHVQFRIHPSVGIARMGNSEAAFHISNEFPTFLHEKFPNLRPRPLPRTHPWDFGANASKNVATTGFSILNSTDAATNLFKDNAGKVMPQAARFRIFAYLYSSATSPRPVRIVEVTTGMAEIEWKVRLGNVKSITSTGGRKNAFNLSAAPLSLSTNGPSKPAMQIKNGTRPALGVLFLEQVATDNTKATGRLLVIGNRGETQGTGVPGTLWSDDWFDAAADGPVEAVIKPDMAKLRAAAELPATETLFYLDHGVAAPSAAAAGMSVNALPAWCVMGLPDYSPDMGHFVSLHDVAVESALANMGALTAPLKAKAEPGQHRRIDNDTATNDYWHWDYDINILPQLCLFGDVNAVSSFANARHVDADGNKLGHNKPVAPARMKIAPRDPADDADLRKPGVMTATVDVTKPPRNWLKKGLFERLRKPETLYREPRWFIKDEGDLTNDVKTYDTNRLFPRRLGRRTQFKLGSRYPVDGAPFDATDDPTDLTKDLDLGFPHEVAQPANLKAHQKVINKTVPRLCGTEQSFNLKDGSSASDEQRLLDDQYWPATPADMPLLRELAYTRLQYEHFEDWSLPTPIKHKPKYDKIVLGPLKTFFAASHTQDEYFAELLKNKAVSLYAPALLDLAHLGAMLGGSFLPGIESGREGGVAQNWALYHGGTADFPDVRLHPCNGTTPHPPGLLTKDLAIPWQRDYAACDETYWPTSRPGEVVRETSPSTSPPTFTEGHAWMAADVPPLFGETAAERNVRFYKDYWHMLGFVRREAGDRFVERERASGI